LLQRLATGQPPLAEVLAPSMLFHFMSTKMVRKELMVAADSQHLPAVTGRTIFWQI
jgi:hypothetical protein